MAAAALLTSCAGVDPGATGSSPPVVERDTSRSRPAGSPRLGGLQDDPAPYDNARAMAHVRALAGDIGVRVRATAGEHRGIAYVSDELRRLGYRVDVQEFAVDGETSHNVVATPPDPRRQKLVIGAHIDTVAGSPGANDNASGVAVMLEAARIFAGTPQARWLRFVAFGSEEYGTNGLHHVGSQVFVNRQGERGRRRIAGMISVDMIADGRPLIIATAGIGPPRVALTLYRKLERAGIGVDYRVTCDCSDNGPFERAGIPASLMWSGIEPNYHDESDRVGNLRRKHLRRTGRAVRTFLKAVDAGMISYFQDS